MNKKLSALTFLLPLAILGAILPGQIIPRAYAAGSGLICIAQVTDTNCPVGLGPTFNGPLTTPNTLLRIPVMINDTDPFNGFDITLNSSDVTKLKPYGVDLAGNIMPTGSITLLECVGGVLILGNLCAATDNPTTVHLVAVGPFGFLFSPGTTGLLFTAIFSITGTTLPGGVTINYQNGCDPTTSSSGTLCVSLSNGTTTPVTESTRTGGFDNSDTTLLPYATLSTTSTNLGQSLAGAPTHALPATTYTATPQNGFDTSATPTLNLAASVNGTGTRPTVSLSPSFVDLTTGPQTFVQTGSVTSTVPAGVYLATVTATYQTQDLTFTTSSLSATYSLPVNVTDYTIGASPNPVIVQPAGSQPVTVTIAPKANFNTLVKLGLTIPAATASAGIGATYSSSTISGGSGTSTLTITTTSNTPAGTYTLTITSNTTLSGFTKTHTTTLTIKAGGFTMSATSPAPQNIGTAETSTITVTYLNGFTGSILLTNNTVTNLLCQAISQTSFTTNGTTTVSCLSMIGGTYSLTITATSGPSRSTTATFSFTIQTHDVAIAGSSISPSGQVTVGTKISVTVQLQNKGPADEEIKVNLLVDGTVTVATTNVTLLGNSSQNVTLTWDTSAFAAKEYTLTVSIELPSGEVNTESNAQVLSQDIGSSTLQAVTPPPSIDFAILAIIAGVIIVAAAGIFLLVRRRGTRSDISQPGIQ